MKFPAALNPLRGTKFKWVIPFAWATLKYVAITAPITIEVFLHHRFGARSGILLLKGFAVVATVVILSTQSTRPDCAPLFPGFLFSYTVLSIAHWLGRDSLERQHPVRSYSSGEPWPFWRHLPFGTYTIKRYIEPALITLIALILSSLDHSLGCWLLFSAIALFVQEQCLRHQIRTRQWDAIDSRVEANIFAPPRPGEENEEFVDARPAPPPNRRR
jgi:hypothetical protein